MASVRIVEVGPRDGLQNISQKVPTETKVELIKRLAAAGLSSIEATSFVSPKWVPQLGDAKEVLKGIQRLQQSRVVFPVLVPNLQGLENAYENGAREVAVFISATEGFSQRNINCTVDESLDRAGKVMEGAKVLGIKVRGYVSCIFADPYDGPTDPSQVLRVTNYLLDHGCYEVSLGDTLGVGTPANVKVLLKELLRTIPASKLAGHYHDTYGQAIANVLQSYEMGIRAFDSSVSGLGGCPFAVGAKGNLATEDLVYTLHSMGVSTGVDLEKLVSVGDWISKFLGISNGSRAGAALMSKRISTVKPKVSVETKGRGWKVVSSSSELSVYKRGPNIKVVLSRPANGNALTASMIKNLTAFFRQLSTDKRIYRIILTAEGKFFCTGMDLSKESGTPEERFKGLKDLFDAMDACPQTTIAAVNGPCFGGGVGLAFVCDLRIFTANATVRLTEVRLGLCPAVISRYVIREMGFNFARTAMLTAREVSASELANLHLIYEVVGKNASLDDRLEQLLDSLRFSAPEASSLCKGLVDSAWRDAGNDRQAKTIENSFDIMMAGSESAHALTMFQKGIKGVNWDEYGQRRQSKL